MQIISELTITSTTLKNTDIISESTTTSTYLAYKEIISQTTQISISFDNEENNFKGILNDISFYVFLGILVVLLISNSTFIYLYRKR